LLTNIVDDTTLTSLLSANTYTFFSLSYEISKFIFTLGGNNIFNTYTTPQFDGWTDQGSLMDSVQMGSDGAYFFGRISFKL